MDSPNLAIWPNWVKYCTYVWTNATNLWNLNYTMSVQFWNFIDSILGRIESTKIKTPGVSNGYLVLSKHVLWMWEILYESVNPADSPQNFRFFCISIGKLNVLNVTQCSNSNMMVLQYTILGRTRICRKKSHSLSQYWTLTLKYWSPIRGHP